MDNVDVFLLIILAVCSMGAIGSLVIFIEAIANGIKAKNIFDTMRELIKGDDTMKTKDIGCEFCNKFDFSTASVEIKGDKAYVVLSACNTRFPENEQFKYCPICGRQIRKEAEE